VIGIVGLFIYFRSIVRVMLLNRRERDLVEVWARFWAVTIVHGLAGRGREYRHVQRMQAWSLPLFIFFAVTTWFLLVLLSFTCILWALRTEPSWARALSSSGSALSTLGFLTPSTLLGEYLAIFEAAIGLAIVILLFTFVPGYLAAVQARERRVGWLYARTGRHPNCLSLLEALKTSGRLNNPGVWEDWEIWFRGVLETHSISPILAYVPSVYSGTTWVSASAAVLDTTSLLLATLDNRQTDAARICRETGVTLVRLIAKELHRHRAIEDRASSHLDAQAIKIFDQLYDKLHEFELPIKTHKEECRERFVTLRSEYESDLRHIARSTLMPIEELGIPHHASHDASVTASHSDTIT
jgi:hypothetical protein